MGLPGGLGFTDAISNRSAVGCANEALALDQASKIRTLRVAFIRGLKTLTVRMG